MVDMSKMLKQARKLQEQMAKVQEELASMTVEATTGGGRARRTDLVDSARALAASA